VGRAFALVLALPPFLLLSCSGLLVVDREWVVVVVVVMMMMV